MKEHREAIYEFGPFSLNPSAHQLRCQGESLRPTPKALEVLLILVENAGRVVTKEELLKRVWPDTYIQESNLTQTIYMLRRILDDTEGKQYIQTVARKGYRFVSGVRAVQNRVPWFQRLTFQRGTIQTARFAPDNHTVIYSAAWEGNPFEIFMTRPESPESRSLDFHGAGLLGISPLGEMAILMERRLLRGYISSGTLARVSLAGGEPRKIAEHVQWADWSPRGDEPMIVREVRGLSCLEFPAGRTLYTTSGWISHPRFSPDKENPHIAFIDHPIQNDDRGSVVLIRCADGQRETLSQGWISAQGLAWSPSGDEVWFTAARTGNARALRAVRLATGETRVIERGLGGLTLHDISREGSVLLTRDNVRIGINFLPPGKKKERNLSHQDWSLLRDLSADGEVLLFTEAGEAGGASYSVYIRRTYEKSPVRLGEGSALALSPDVKWALTKLPSSPPQLILLPTGAGKPQRIEPNGLNYHQWAAWFPEGERILFTGTKPDEGTRLYVQNLSDGESYSITPEIEGVHLTTPHAISPDGERVAALGPDEKIYLYPIAGGEPHLVKGLEMDDVVSRWAADGRSLYIYRRGEIPTSIFQFDLLTGEKRFWKKTQIADATGVHEILRLLLTPDGTSHAYTYTCDLSDLYQINSLI